MPELLPSTIEAIKPLDEAAMARARSRQDTLTKPPGSLGRLEELSTQLAGIQARPIPVTKDKAIITMAADHGVVAEKIGNWPQEVTAQMVYNFLRGGAAINVIAHQVGARVIVVDMGVAAALKPDPSLLVRKIGPGTKNMALGPAMTESQAVMAIDNGIAVVQEEATRGLDIVGTGDMGIGNTTASSAICAVMTGRPAAEVTGRGTGLTDAQLAHKISVIERALAVNHPDPERPLDVRIPVVIDGFISGAAALIAVALSPQLRDYLIAAHLSAEPGHRITLEHIGLKPWLELDMRLGEGTGAGLGIFLAETAAGILRDMATFAEAGVSEGDQEEK
jgi:nicotinate-nucleotide--dimethylbenzimidazole phosphoribosyltransferase